MVESEILGETIGFYFFIRCFDNLNKYANAVNKCKCPNVQSPFVYSRPFSGKAQRKKLYLIIFKRK